MGEATHGLKQRHDASVPETEGGGAKTTLIKGGPLETIEGGLIKDAVL
jgi:hypothetical protein